jgi:hypothetical protein
MALRVGVVAETAPGENRVALTPRWPPGWSAKA